MGRHKKPPGEALANSIRIRVTDDERTRLEAEAARHGKGLSAWARSVLLAATRSRKRQLPDAPGGR